MKEMQVYTNMVFKFMYHKSTFNNNNFVQIFVFKVLNRSREQQVKTELKGLLMVLQNIFKGMGTRSHAHACGESYGVTSFPGADCVLRCKL